MNRSEIWKIRASRTVGFRAVGGHLLFDGVCLEFRPHRVERLLAPTTWSAEKTIITTVDVAKRAMHPFNGSLRRRIHVGTEREDEYFVVHNAKSVAQLLVVLLNAGE